jgi:hypothetical protein
MNKTILKLTFCLSLVAGIARAEVVRLESTPAHVPSAEIGTRIRWGANNFEASILDGSTHAVQLNPTGAPVWIAGLDYPFSIAFEALTGQLSLSVDFNRDGDFLDASEAGAKSEFSVPGQSSYAGFGFTWFSISYRQSGFQGSSQISGLAINGTALESLTAEPNSSAQWLYANDNGALFADLTVSGRITFLTAGTKEERPAWDFGFRDPLALPPPTSPEDAVPEPASAALLLIAGSLLLFQRRFFGRF